AQVTTNASARTKTVTGFVYDETGVGVPGSTITIKGSTRGVATDLDGSFKIDVSPTDVLEVSFLGYDLYTVEVGDKANFVIPLKPKANELDEVTIVAFGTQKKESVISAISTINAKDLYVPSNNLTTALAGKISGIVAYQRSGEPGADNADFFIRGVTTFGYTKSPLILIDNVELTTDDLARLNVDDIASFSIMKDATAAALYGSRGANGVILVTTKEGQEGKTKLNIRVENSFSAPTSMVKTVDPISYMKLNNEAALTRDPLARRPFSNEKIAATQQGLNPYMYPAVNWYDELFNDYASNQRVNLNVSGGGSVARYYVAGSFANESGILKVDPKNNFNNNINLKRVSLRSNVNINLTKTTQLDVRLSGNFEDYNGPVWSGTDVFNMAMQSSPVAFPKYYVSDTEFTTAIHPLFGNTQAGDYLNPYAEMVSGYQDYSRTVMIAQLELKQALDFITEGLRFRLLGSTTRNSFFDMQRQYAPFYYRTSSYDKVTDKFGLILLNPTGGRDFLNPLGSNKDVSTSYYFEGALNWNRTFNDAHELSAMAVGVVRQTLYSDATSLQTSLAHRNLGVSGRLTYAYDHRYFVEGNFGYNGSERFADKERFGFFPSAGLGWIVSNESFWNDELKTTVSKLKLKGTYGLVGNDAIGDVNDRFFYLSTVNLNDNSKQPFYYGEDFTYRPGGTSISSYSNPFISWETSRKANLGIEIGLFDRIEIQADYFTEYRTNILMTRTSVPSTMGLQADLRANVGEYSSHGYEVSVDAKHSFNKDFWLTGRANLTYANGQYEVFEEPTYPYPWLSSKGLSFDQQKGLIAERLFIDDADIANSPRQTFGSYLPGDIKYKDINDDGIIDSQDVVPIGFPETPRVMYGFGLSTGFKGLDFSFFFQGSAQSSFFIDQTKSAPFLNQTIKDKSGVVRNTNNAVLQTWADSHWSEENRNIYALWPRLSTEIVTNNNQNSTWFLRDGAFLRLKSVELGYTLPHSWTNKAHIGSARLYLSGTNLLLFSVFDTWDVEMGNNGLGYPVQRVANIGLNLSF
ncbi:SusC/RagA family TonB-linked outer membrane protein, partial [Candidatus Symbiothrix dinenymphae]|uniref:SusC/RagA family TonB-linked outer membrane protein n=1 Tax=Candidatus Symbiothrix dinenymphae TaxID=467085 RepID=UPI000AFCC198